MKRIKEYWEISKSIFRNYWLYIVPPFILFLLLASILLIVGFHFNFTESTGLYFYSSLLQANAAIISIFGVFFIYKVQSLQSSILDIFNSISTTTPDMKRALKFKLMNLDEKKERLNDFHDDSAESILYRQWYNSEIDLEKIRKKIIGPSILLIIAIIFEAIFLILSNEINLYLRIFEFLSYTINILYEGFLLGLLVKTIFEITLK